MVTSLQEWRESRQARIPFTELDWQVIEMARANGPWNLNPDEIVAMLARFVFSLPDTGSLADPKLEALRRFSVRAWYRDQIRARDMSAFLAAGYSRRHALEILSHVGMRRGFVPHVEEDGLPPAPRGQSSRCRCG